MEEIIREADVGRATFYAHFETRDFLLKALCEELFCHIFDASLPTPAGHRHIFQCDAPQDMFLHLFRHLNANDNHILDLLSGENNGIFLRYFKSGLLSLIARQMQEKNIPAPAELPENFWVHHIAASFVETVSWWLENGRRETPEEMTRFFLQAAHFPSL